MSLSRILGGFLGRSSPARTPRCRLALERLDGRDLPSAVVVAGPSPVHLPVAAVHKGDVLQFRVEDWKSDDADEGDEDEPLLLKASGTPVPFARFPLDQGGLVSYTAKADGETFTAQIKGGDGDEWVTVVTPSAGVDLAAAVDTRGVVPTAAKDLNLFHLFGDEPLTVPVRVENQGASAANGQVTVTLALSRTPDLNSQPITLASKTVDVALASLARKVVTFDVRVPKTGPAAGTDYYLVASIKPVGLTDGQPKNNLAATDRTFRYLGTPSSNLTVFADGTYFRFVRDALKGAAIGPSVDPTDAKSFIGFFEGDVLHPYLDTKHIPTIGVGINLNTVSGGLKADLAAAVRAYYAAAYKQKLTGDDTAVIAMLRTQAGPSAKQAISAADDQKLFDKAFAQYRDAAKAAFGADWNLLTARERVVAIDLAYNAGSVFPGVKKALIARDSVLAGFNLVDAKRTNQAPGLINRTRGDYLLLLAGHADSLGRLV